MFCKSYCNLRGKKPTCVGAILPVLQVFPMAQNEMEEFSLENMETPRRLEEIMVSARDGSACHPWRGP